MSSTFPDDDDTVTTATRPAPSATPALLPDPPAPRSAHRTSTDVALVATFAVVVAGLVLGARRGFLAVALYLVVGLAGVPVFAEMTGGLGVLGKPSVGYLLAFPLAAAVAGWLGGRALRTRPVWRFPLLVAAGLGSSFLVTHPAGVLGLMARLGVGAREAVAIDAVYWPGDVVKNLLAAGVTLAVLRAFPDLRPGRRSRP